MEYKALQNDVSRDWKTGKAKIEYLIETPLSDDAIRGMSDKVLRVKVVGWKEKRSLDANAYYWKLLTELAGKLEVSKPYLHNHMLRFYGQMEIIDGKMIYVVVPDDEGGIRRADEAETYHIKPTSEIKTGKNEESYRTYIMLRGSSTYDTAEMSKLIDGLVQECKEQGIQTLPPKEFDRMMQMYKQNRRKE